jgi:hypothetical protein
MARRRNPSHGKTFQQRQTERKQAEEARDRTMIEDMAKTYCCSNGIARDFAEQCELRIDDLDFDLLCSTMALDFWASGPPAAQPVVDLLCELAEERRRHQAALTSLRERLLATTWKEAVHQHLDLPIEHYRGQVRERIFPDPDRRPVQNHAESDAR